MILNDGLNVLAPNGFGVDPDPDEGTEEVAAPASEPKRGRRVKTPATAPTATTPEEAPEAATAAGPADSSEAAETTTDTATDTTTEETE